MSEGYEPGPVERFIKKHKGLLAIILPMISGYLYDLEDLKMLMIFSAGSSFVLVMFWLNAESDAKMWKQVMESEINMMRSRHTFEIAKLEEELEALRQDNRSESIQP